MNRFFNFFFICFLLSNVNIKAQSRLSQEKKIYMLSEIWKEVSYSFCDSKRLLDIHWDSIYLTNITKVLDTKSDYEFYLVLRKFLVNIEDGHTNLELQNLTQTLSVGELPIAIKKIDNRIFLFGFISDNLNNVALGSEIIQINNLPVLDYINKFVLPYTWGSTLQWRTQNAVENVFGFGLIGDSLNVQFKTTEGNFKDIWLKYQDKNKFIKANFKTLPSFRPKPRYEILDDSFLYLKPNSFELNYSVKYLQRNANIIYKAKGIIIDLRDNRGGNEDIADSLLMCFLDLKTMKTYKSLTRKHNGFYAAMGYGYPTYKSYYDNQTMDTLHEEIIQKGELPTFLQPMVILIGTSTCSAAEDFLLALKLNAPKRAILIGTPTAGSTGAPLVRFLNSGAYYRICTRRPLIETDFFKNGIQPDIYYEKTVEEYLQNEDTIINIAKRKINSMMY